MKTRHRILGIVGSVALLWGVLPFGQAVLAQTSATQTSQTPATEAQSLAPFSDVQPENKHYMAIKYLKDQGYVEGFPDGTFRPGNDIDRAQALAMLFKVLKPKPARSIAKMSFADVKPTQWFYPIIQEAFSKSIVRGYPDKLFHPEKKINKAESLKAALLLENNTLPDEVTQKPYSDVETDVWYAIFAQVSRQRSLFTESRDHEGALYPDETLNRGQFAELMYRMIKSKQESSFGRATFYADFLAGHGTSGGDAYDPTHLTTAHPTLPFGTKLLVKNLANGKEVEVVVNDRGPYAIGVHLDLSKTAFSTIASVSTGIINIEYKVVQ